MGRRVRTARRSEGPHAVVEDAPTKTALRKRKDIQPALLSIKTINNALTVLRKMLSLAQEHGIITHVPRVKLFKTAKAAFDFLSFEEAERVVAAAAPAWRAVVLVALKTGDCGKAS